jgi:ribosomal protein L37AE/L43A
MAKNRVQFQKGLSAERFLAAYGTEDLCRAALIKLRWPDGFVCPQCKSRTYCMIEPRGLFQCSSCRLQTSVRAGTIFHGSRTPLTKWFWAIYLMTQSKNDIAALEMKRQLGVKYDTAWLIKQKLLGVMLKRNVEHQLDGDVQIDDAYLGGEHAETKGKAGRGSPNKVPFIAAVSTRDGQPHQIHLRCVDRFTKMAIMAYAMTCLAPGAKVVTDGLSCFPGIAAAGFAHQPITTGSGKRPIHKQFRWVNTVLGNIKSAIIGTCRSLAGNHASHYLAGYEYRFNHRYDLADMVPSLAHIALRTGPIPYRTIVS